ncbi:tRNA (cytosine(38)-C(5))-methyltransferase isoform X1 [Schistocerca serialis cubense]|uniref:tRNA (cytosine(38)-C(5))-methyltransferase isoform X1 n=1 Tax=Schistocerca serialis cubense TaxID=2023355 RepID=UPI00214F474E|nr:tRNA (cytosine(38)-C(5))-methyltransferase isoform X1 [Schistocerca serialis cubense]XP_049951687.1 tRNA (cytosine(38)-C(5))-methyltransferase isoform X1 [Schistocerca serialis cubense]
MGLRVLELFSGIGGMHYALRESCSGEVVAAVDINTVANLVYTANFPQTKLLQKNIESLTAEEINNMGINMILMSPPCQPFTRNGLQKDMADNRTSPFLHFLRLLPELTGNLKYILLENVKGFEKSEARDMFVNILQEANFIFQEFLLSPLQFHIPNSRTRYYLIAKQRPLNFSFSIKPLVDDITQILDGNDSTLYKTYRINTQYRELAAQEESHENSRDKRTCFSLSHILEKENADNLSSFKLPNNILLKYACALDIVFPLSKHSCCFTKAYGHYVVGTGSVLSSESTEYVLSVAEKIKSHECESEQCLDLLHSLQLRYFTPLEIARLMCFPPDFSFPIIVNRKQRYRLLGNSVNVHVVSVLITLLVTDK